MSTKPLFQYISGGPPREQLLDSLKYAYDDQKIYVIFTVGRTDEPCYLLKVLIKSLKYESGERNQFFFEADMAGGRERGRIKGYYNAAKREGVFEKIMN